MPLLFPRGKLLFAWIIDPIWFCSLHYRIEHVSVCMQVPNLSAFVATKLYLGVPFLSSAFSCTMPEFCCAIEHRLVFGTSVTILCCFDPNMLCTSLSNLVYSPPSEFSCTWKDTTIAGCGPPTYKHAHDKMCLVRWLSVELVCNPDPVLWISKGHQYSNQCLSAITSENFSHKLPLTYTPVWWRAQGSVTKYDSYTKQKFMSVWLCHKPCIKHFFWKLRAGPNIKQMLFNQR